MSKIKCSHCGFNNGIESDIQLHHIVPKSIGGTDKDGRRYLCKKCHDIIHKKLLPMIWWFIPNDKKQSAKQTIILETDNWIYNYKITKK